jgi:hypothetical protein
MTAEARRRIAEETIDIYAPLAGRMGMQEMRSELEDICFRELNPEAYEVIVSRLAALAARNHDLVSEIETQLRAKLADSGIDAEVKGRQKRPYSIWRKMERKSIAFEQLSDIFGFRSTRTGEALRRSSSRGNRTLMPGCGARSRSSSKARIRRSSSNIRSSSSSTTRFSASPRRAS